MRLASLLAALTLITAPAQSADVPCGGETPCEIEGGSYHLLPPPGWDGESAMPAVVFFHGHRSSGKGILGSAGLKNTFSEAGYTIIGPNGALREDGRTRGWPGRPGSARDDVAFTLAVLEDAARHLPIDADQIYATGFSAGGSMAWMMACYAGEHFAGFASVAGALRRPNPEACPGGPVRILQIHGFTDKQVPLEGRGIRDWHQGDVFESLGLARTANQCRSNPDAITVSEPFRCRTWTSCENGAVKMCLHDGGHGLPKGWTDLAKEWMEGE